MGRRTLRAAASMPKSARSPNNTSIRPTDSAGAAEPQGLICEQSGSAQSTSMSLSLSSWSLHPPAPASFSDPENVGVVDGVRVAVRVGVELAMGVGVPVRVDVGVAEGPGSQNPVPGRLMQRFAPEGQLSATPPEQSASVVKRATVPAQVPAQTLVHCSSVVIAPDPQQPATLQLPHGVQSQLHTQQTACATGTQLNAVSATTATR